MSNPPHCIYCRAAAVYHMRQYGGGFGVGLRDVWECLCCHQSFETDVPPRTAYSPVLCDDGDDDCCPPTQRQPVAKQVAKPNECHLCHREARKSVYDDRIVCTTCGVEVKGAA